MALFEGESIVLACASVMAAAACGYVAWCEVSAWRRRQHHRSAVMGEDALALATSGAASADASLAGRVIAYAAALSQRLQTPSFRGWAPSLLQERSWPSERAQRAGASGSLTGAGFWEARVRLAVGGAGLACAIGAMASIELGLVLGCVGGIAGWKALPRALEQRSRQRARAMERNLSEMLDVMALGLRSGMSFERSLDLYTEYFRTPLAAGFRSARRQWACGLASRSEALREVAGSYASPLLARVIENIVRSLRFGSTLADNLEDAAREARADYKARRQEEAAKAPVKMMVPTGALILPAMLMLVLGPVLLELAAGF